jgi:carboxyl-terminal processing protease
VLVLAAAGACDADGAGTSEQPVVTASTMLARSPSSTQPAGPTLVRDERWLMQALELIEQHAYYSDRIDWPSRYGEAREFVATVLGPARLGTFVSATLDDLGDNHSRLVAPTVAEELVAAQPRRDVEPSGEALDGDIGYLLLPGFAGGARREGDQVVEADTPAVRAYVNAARRLLVDPNVCGWILDLRRNDGGNAFPMLSAVAPLLGAGVFVGFKHRDGMLSGIEITEDGSTGEATDVSLLGPKPGSQPPQVPLPVAVLTNGVTGSAGEAVAIALKGRPHTRSFGSPTAGVPTANDGFFLSDGSLLLLTVAVDVDRNGNMYESPIAPDEPTDAAIGNRPRGEAALATATEWLRTTDSCR